jgi:selenocysteine lyase/cysteine desulfurase
MEPISDKELEEYRYLFPVTKKYIYMNHAGVAPISYRVADSILLFNQEALRHGYTEGPRWVKRFEEIREKCGQLINAHADEIAFVKNTSHGISLVARGLGLQSGDEVILSEVEFPANVYPWMALEKHGVKIKKIPSVAGELKLENLKELITPQTKVVSLSSVQYGTGYRLPVAQVGEICRGRGIYFFLDAIQSLGAFPADVREGKVDFLAADAHKWMLGHEGIGIFYVRKELLDRVEPVLLGWHSVSDPLNFEKLHFTLANSARRFEEGSHNGLSIYGLGGAVELLLEVGVERIARRILQLTDRLIEGLKQLGLPIHNSLDPKFRSGIVMFSLPGDKTGEELGRLERHLFSKKIYTSIRCGCIRLSPHFYNSEEEIETVLKEISDFLQGE